MRAASDIAIRFATPQDAAAVHDMICALAEATHDRSRVTGGYEDIRQALSGDTPAIHGLIAERAGQAVGVAICFFTFSTWRGKPGIYIQDLYVADDVRGSGLGKRLLGAVASWAASRGANHLRLSVDQDNASAMAFYESAGLSRRGDEMIFEADETAFANLVEAT